MNIIIFRHYYYQLKKLIFFCINQNEFMNTLVYNNLLTKMDYMKKIQESIKKSVLIFKQLEERSDELPKGKYTIKPSGGFAFRYKLEVTANSKFEEVSISTPPDAHGAIETALVKNNELVFDNEELGYDDVQRFSNVDELIKELHRLS